MLTPLIQIETLTGEPVKIQDTQLRVRSQVFQLRFPLISGGLIWNRPVAVLVRTADGQDQILPVRDLTRTIVITLLLLPLTGIFLFSLIRRKK